MQTADHCKFEEIIPEKKQAVYDAVCAFIEEGRDTSGLTVSEITKRAGIGKGTAYEYFDSKEEMVEGAVCSRIVGLQKQAIDDMKARESLRGCLDVLCDLFDNNSYDLLMYHVIRGKSMCFNDPDEIRETMRSFTVAKTNYDREITRILIHAAEEEFGKPSNTDADYINIAVTMVIHLIREASFSHKMTGDWTVGSREKMLDECLGILKKLLKQ